MSKVVLVECWSNTHCLVDPKGEQSRETMVAYVAKDTTDAILWCQENNDYNGDHDAWHWCFVELEVGEDMPWQGANVEHYTRHLERCDYDGVAKHSKEWPECEACNNEDQDENEDDDDSDGAESEDTFENELSEVREAQQETNHLLLDVRDELQTIATLLRQKNNPHNNW